MDIKQCLEGLKIKYCGLFILCIVSLKIVRHMCPFVAIANLL